VIVRDIPGRGYIRVSVGAWCLDDDLEQLAELAAAAAATPGKAVGPSPRRATVILDRSATLPPQADGDRQAPGDETA
jgi:hypothetical protein